jgi:hypothetical protein
MDASFLISTKSDAKMVRFPVFLARSTHRGRAGNTVSLSERRLIRQNEDDPVIAIVEAPKGSRVRTRPDENGPDQLIVPLVSTLWGRFFGARVVVPAKYIIGDAHRRAYGLSLAEGRGQGP